jgi:2-hydroxy-3-oxopropionate reductase
MTSPTRVGFIGLGVMGQPMARNLLAKGFPLTVLRHRNPSAPDALAKLGATVAATPADLARRVDVVILMLPSSREVETVVTGPGGLEHFIRRSQVILDMGTSDPASTRTLAARLDGQGVAYLDAPVSGGVSGAEAGTLTIMVGGPAEVFDRIHPILRAMGTTVLHVGGVGAGHAVKIINNLIAVSTSALIAEALGLTEAAGLSRIAVLDILRCGSANSRILQETTARIQTQRFEPGFKCVLARKDLMLAEALAAATGVQVPMAAAARRMFDEACAAGLGERDVAAIMTMRGNEA